MTDGLDCVPVSNLGKKKKKPSVYAQLTAQLAPFSPIPALMGSSVPVISTQGAHRNLSFLSL